MKPKTLSKITGISLSAVYNILAGNRRPSWETAKKLASATGIAPELWMDDPESVRGLLKGKADLQ
jgi:plasmid maintenance system antidote protein VapI